MRLPSRVLVAGIAVLVMAAAGAALAAQPATRPARQTVRYPDGDHGKVLRVDDKSITVAPIARERSAAQPPGAGAKPDAPPPSPADEAAAENAPPKEKTYKLDENTRIMSGVVTAERVTSTGDTIRSMEMSAGKVSDIKPGFEVFVVSGDDGAARQVAVIPLPMFERGRPRSGAAGRGGATTRRAGETPTTRRAGGMLFGSGPRGKVVRADENSVTLVPADDSAGGGGTNKPATELTFKVDERTRIMIPQQSEAEPGPDGRIIRRVSFIAGTAAQLKPGQEVAVTPDPTDAQVARRLMIVPEGFGTGRGPRPATAPATAKAAE